MSIRSEKVAGVIQKALYEPVRELAHEHHAGLVTITSVRMSGDLHIAKVYFSLYSGKLSPSEFIDILDKKQGYLRSLIGRQLKLRYTPELKFFVDDTLEQMDYIRRLMDKVKEEDSTIPHHESEETDEEPDASDN